MLFKVLDNPKADAACQAGPLGTSDSSPATWAGLASTAQTQVLIRKTGTDPLLGPVAIEQE